MKKLFAHCVTHNEGIGKIGKEFLNLLDGTYEIALKTIDQFWLHQPPTPSLRSKFLLMINRFHRMEDLKQCDLQYSNLSIPFLELIPSLPQIVETFWETDHLPDEWVEKIDQVDELWLATDFLIEMFKRSGVPNSKIRKMPFGIEVPEKIDRIFPKDGTFRMLFLSSFTYRKGVHFLIKAFLEEFSREEKVELVLRTSPFVISLEEMNLTIRKLNQSVRKKHKPKMILLSRPLSEMNLWSLINSCDAIISPSLGEGFNRSVVEGMILGKPPITTNCPPMNEFVSERGGYLIDHLGLVPVTNMNNIGDYAKWFDQKYNHKWYMPAFSSIKEQMRLAFEDFKSGEIEAKKEHLARFKHKWDWSNFIEERIERMEAISR